MTVAAAVSGIGQRITGALPTDSWIQPLPDFGGIKYVHMLTGGREFDGGGTVEIDASSLQLSLHIGDGFGAIISMMFRFIMEILWGIYSAAIRIIAWFADVAMGMGWLSVIRGPFDSIEAALTDMMKSFNLYGVMLVVTAFVCAIWIARGKWGQALGELAVALLVANFAVASIGGSSPDGELTSQNSFQPMDVLIGNNGDETGEGERDGLIYDAVGLGYSVLTDVKAQMATDGQANASGEGYDPQKPSTGIVQTFLWYPLQLVNFGEVLSEECQDSFAITIRTIQDGEDGGTLEDRLEAAGLSTDGVGDEAQYLDEGWKVPGACQHDDDEYYDDQANFTGLLTQFMLGPTVTVVMIVVLVLAFFVVVAGVNAVIQALKLIFTLLAAILPGGARRPLWMTIGAVFASLAVVVYLILAFGLLLIVINEVYANQSDGGIWQRIGTLLLVDFLLLVGLFVLWKGKKSVEAWKEKVGEFMAKLTPSSGGGGGGGSAFGGGAMGGAAGSLAMSALAGKAFGGGNTMAGIRARELDHKEHQGRLAGLGMPGGPPNDFPQVMGGGAKGARLRRKYDRRKNNPLLYKGLGMAKGLVGKAALGFMTGGSSLLVQGGAMAVKSKALRAVAKGAGKLAGKGLKNGVGKPLNFMLGKKSFVGSRVAQGVMGARNAVLTGGRTVGELGRRAGLAASRQPERLATWGANKVAKATDGRLYTGTLANKLEDHRDSRLDAHRQRAAQQAADNQFYRDYRKSEIEDIREARAARVAEREVQRNRWKTNHP